MNVPVIECVVALTFRKPFSGKSSTGSTSGPLRADHSIMTDATAATGRPAAAAAAAGDAQRPASVASDALTSSDDRLNELQREFNELMETYGRLKELRPTPERDRQMNTLLEVSVTARCGQLTFFALLYTLNSFVAHTIRAHMMLVFVACMSTQLQCTCADMRLLRVF